MSDGGCCDEEDAKGVVVGWFQVCVREPPHGSLVVGEDDGDVCVLEVFGNDRDAELVGQLVGQGDGYGWGLRTLIQGRDMRDGVDREDCVSLAVDRSELCKGPCRPADDVRCVVGIKEHDE